MAKHQDANEVGLPRWTELLREVVDTPGVIADCYHTFHDYSPGNQMLAWWQCTTRKITPGPLGTFKKWKSLGRTVIKGQKAIWLCMPITWQYEKENDEGEKKQFTAMRFVYKPHWFVLSQTEGEDYIEPAMPGWELGDALIGLEVEPVEFSMTDGNCMGYAAGRTFAINPIGKHQNATTFHELAHIVLGHTEEADFTDTKTRTPRNVKEMEAEATAMIVMDALGEKDHAQSRGYIQNWYGKNEISEESARHIFAAANAILSAGRTKQEQEVAA